MHSANHQFFPFIYPFIQSSLGRSVTQIYYVYKLQLQS